MTREQVAQLLELLKASGEMMRSNRKIVGEHIENPYYRGRLDESMIYDHLLNQVVSNLLSTEKEEK